MGFLDLVCECASTLASGIKSVVTGIGSALSSVGMNVGAAVSTLRIALEAWAPQIGMAIRAIGICVDVVAKICGILRQNETVAEIGERALQAGEDGITLKSCDNDFKAYMKRLREFNLDPYKAEKRTTEEKLLAGSEVLEKGINELHPNMSTAAFWPVLALGIKFFSPERLEAYAKYAMEHGDSFGESLGTFFLPREDEHVGKKIYDFVFAAEKFFNPSATPNQIQKEFDKVEQECAARMSEK